MSLFCPMESSHGEVDNLHIVQEGEDFNFFIKKKGGPTFLPPPPPWHNTVSNKKVSKAA